MHVTSATLALSFAGAALGLFLAAAPATQATSPTIKPGGKPPEGVTRLALYDNTPGVLPGRDTEGDPRIPTIDLYPLAKRAGVLEFRITLDPSELKGAQGNDYIAAKQSLKQNGPGHPLQLSIGQARWMQISPQNIENFSDPATHNLDNSTFVTDTWSGKPYVLCYDDAPHVLTHEQQKNWSVSADSPYNDPNSGGEVLPFTMDAFGAEYMGTLTAANKGHHMAILLNDMAITAPTIDARITKNGVITFGRANATHTAKAIQKEAEDLQQAMDAGARTTAVVILPGGGYVNLSTTREGTDIARLFNAHGVAAFVIRYRHAPRYRSPIPLQDAQRGIRWVRAHATEYNIDAEKIGVIGFSAGGHDAAEIAVATDTAGDPKAADPIERESAKADFAVLAYPVINLSDPSVAHHGSRDALTGGNSALFAPLSPEQHVTSSTPPCFITAGADDRVVPIQNSILFFEACRAAHVPAELHVWEHGSHGFSLGNNSENRQWPTLMFNWLAINKFIPANSTSAR